MTDAKWLYIITSPSNRRDNKYKVGIHTGSQKKLYDRYRTAIPELEFVLFMPHTNPKIVEKEIKSRLTQFRDVNLNNNKSEWFTIDINILVPVCLEILNLNTDLKAQIPISDLSKMTVAELFKFISLNKDVVNLNKKSEAKHSVKDPEIQKLIDDLSDEDPEIKSIVDSMTNVKLDSPRESKDTPKATLDVQCNLIDIKATPKATLKDTPKATLKDTPKATLKDTPKATLKDTPKATLKDTPKATLKDTPKATLKDTPKESHNQPLDSKLSITRPTRSIKNELKSIKYDPDIDLFDEHYILESVLYDYKHGKSYYSQSDDISKPVHIRIIHRLSTWNDKVITNYDFYSGKLIQHESVKESLWIVINDGDVFGIVGKYKPSTVLVDQLCQWTAFRKQLIQVYERINIENDSIYNLDIIERMANLVGINKEGDFCSVNDNYVIKLSELYDYECGVFMLSSPNFTDKSKFTLKKFHEILCDTPQNKLSKLLKKDLLDIVTLFDVQLPSGKVTKENIVRNIKGVIIN